MSIDLILHTKKIRQFVSLYSTFYNLHSTFYILHSTCCSHGVSNWSIYYTKVMQIDFAYSIPNNIQMQVKKNNTEIFTSTQ